MQVLQSAELSNFSKLAKDFNLIRHEKNSFLFFSALLGVGGEKGSFALLRCFISLGWVGNGIPHMPVSFLLSWKDKDVDNIYLEGKRTSGKQGGNKLLISH